MKCACKRELKRALVAKFLAGGHVVPIRSWPILREIESVGVTRAPVSRLRGIPYTAPVFELQVDIDR